MSRCMKTACDESMTCRCDGTETKGDPKPCEDPRQCHEVFAVYPARPVMVCTEGSNFPRNRSPPPSSRLKPTFHLHPPPIWALSRYCQRSRGTVLPDLVRYRLVKNVIRFRNYMRLNVLRDRTTPQPHANRWYQVGRRARKL